MARPTKDPYIDDTLWFLSEALEHWYNRACTYKAFSRKGPRGEDVLIQCKAMEGVPDNFMDEDDASKYEENTFQFINDALELVYGMKCSYDVQKGKASIRCRNVKDHMRSLLSYYGKIRDLQDRDDLTLLTDSQDVGAVKDHFGWNEEVRDFDIFFVKTDGDYSEVFGAYGTVPHLDNDVYRVRKA